MSWMISDEVGEGLTLGRLEKMAVGQQPALRRAAVELRAAEVGGQQHRLHALLGAGHDAAELPPVAAELAELHQFVVGDVAQAGIRRGPVAWRRRRASLGSFFRRLPRRLANSVASAMSMRSTQGRKQSMNHSTKPTASTASWEGRGRAQQPGFDLADGTWC